MYLRLIIACLLFGFTAHISNAQDHETFIKSIYDAELREGKSFSMLEDLCLNIGHRLSGSPQAAAAVEWSKKQMEDFGFDTVFLQPVMVPHWVRGKKEIVRVENSPSLGNIELNALAIGNSVGTGEGGVTGEVVEVQNFNQLKELGSEGVKGKIVFFNRGFDPTLIKTFRAYAGAVNQRGTGASNAGRLGALAVVVRSMASNNDYVPHTGALRYAEDAPKIPAVAISTKDADALSEALKKDEGLSIYIETHCEMLPDVLSYNVIGEIRGSEKPDEYLLVGGHLDSWDVGHGAHDDGAGCVQSIEALRLFKILGYRPRHSIRAVMFMNEENGLRGGQEYARVAAELDVKHVAAIESDAGGFSPRGFRMSGTSEQRAKLMSWAPYLNPYGLYELGAPGGGADIGPLGSSGTVLFGLNPDSQRYFNYHHTAEDTIDKVNQRELELGAAAMATLLYLIDREGI